MLRAWIRRAFGTSSSIRRERGGTRPLLERLEARDVPATFTVVNTNDAGAGSLRQAIMDANAAGGADTIQVQIPGAGAKTINLASALPTITGTTVLDGRTQAGYAGVPIVELNGAGAGANANGFTSSAQVTIRGFTINRFLGAGIQLLAGSSSSQIVGNYLGTNLAGTAAAGNRIGVQIHDADNVQVGGAATADRNVISGNTMFGATVAGDVGANASTNRFENNYIGTNAAGGGAVANGFDGLLLASNSVFTAVGSAVAGTGNVISGNGRAGIHLYGDARSSTIQNNTIGLVWLRDAKLANAFGVMGTLSARSNVIGNASAAFGNVISGNTYHGVWLSGGGTAFNEFYANRIGTNYAGAAGLGNGYDGVAITGGAHDNVVGAAGSFTNYLSGNGRAGVYMLDVHDNSTANNVIGLTPQQDAKLGNQFGVYIAGASEGNSVGASGGGNIIAGNAVHGVYLIGAGVRNNQVGGNAIGTTGSGTAGLGNGYDGVAIYGGASDNDVGTSVLNTIAGNGRAGVYLGGVGTSGNDVMNNRIGLAAGGAVVLGNRTGVEIAGGAYDNRVGAASAGNTIGGNLSHGVSIHDVGTSGNLVQSNFIGTNSSNAALGNGDDGVAIYGGAAGNRVGGTASNLRNVIAGNQRYGVYILGAGSNNNLVVGNTLGRPTAASAVGGNKDGVVVGGGAQANRIGDGTTAGRNLISGNGVHGVFIEGLGTMYNTVAGNYIGVDSAGSAILANAYDGVVLYNGASYNTIGGTTAAANTISGNGRVGVTIFNSHFNQLLGNYIGTNAANSTILGNGAHGVAIVAGSTGNLVGDNDGASPNAIRRNGGDGVLIGSDALIGFSAAAGVRNTVRFNSIAFNGGFGIDLGPNDGATANDALDADSGANNLQNTVVMTSALSTAANSVVVIGSLQSTAYTAFRIEFYRNASSTGEAEISLGDVFGFTDANGVLNFNLDLNIFAPLGNYIRAIVTNADGDSSELSNAVQIQ